MMNNNVNPILEPICMHHKTSLLCTISSFFTYPYRIIVKRIFHLVCVIVKIRQLTNSLVLKPMFTDCHLCKQSTKKHAYLGKHVYNMYNGKPFIWMTEQCLRLFILSTSLVFPFALAYCDLRILTGKVMLR